MQSKSFRPETLCQDLVMVDGLAGSGKTMLSPIIASLQRGELMTYAFEVQYYCNLHHMGEISLNGATNLVKLYIDLKLYNSMMGREMNFRPSDLSSALNTSHPERYLARLFDKGDEATPEKIDRIKPIMNFLMHNTLPYAKPIVEAYGKKAKFIEVLRHPLYMVKQQALNFENLIGDKRDIDVYIDFNGNNLPFYTRGWEERFLKANSFEKAILYMDHFIKSFKEANNGENRHRICFEKFVLEPENSLEGLFNFLGTSPGEQTTRVLKESRIPREKIAQGVDLEIYRRCGWTPSKSELSEKDELNLRREMISKEVSEEYFSILESRIQDYESNFWAP